MCYQQFVTLAWAIALAGSSKHVSGKIGRIELHMEIPRPMGRGLFSRPSNLKVIVG